ncbi:hypothetical protein NUW58_g4238 [Xylaria curta]|uniref:Uncharacterized protein n=1 Tax=Xylaria curta TaxID=42375 RepID=A0ACC1P8G4_9PEZI|nr:hypothetical protein NUW58_g4238 [Xylaria curta]
MSDEIRHKFEDFAKRLARNRYRMRKRDRDDPTVSHLDDLESEDDNVHNAELSSRLNDDELSQVVYDDLEFNYAEDDVDSSDDPEQDSPSNDRKDDDKGSSSDNSSNKKPKTKNPGRSNPTFAKAWVSFLQDQPESELLPPRISRIVQLVLELRRNHPEEKIVIVSGRIMLLDIIHKALKRIPKAGPDRFKIVEFNGTILSVNDRAEILRRFNQPGQPAILLLSAGAGGTGLNIAGGSRLIMCEPLWSPGLEAQIQGRLYRMPQKYEVVVYKIHAAESAIDNSISHSHSAKIDARDNLMEFMVRYDGEEFTPVDLPNTLI